MYNKEIKIGKHIIKVVSSSEATTTPEDKSMDQRVTTAVNSAIKKAKVCNKPVAKYDKRTKKAYIVSADGEKKYVI